MMKFMEMRAFNILAVFCANLCNLLITGIMLSRPKRLNQLERILGIVSTALILPLSVVIVFHVFNQPSFWMIALPALMIVFLIFELVFDYLLKLDFRRTRWLGPYLLLFYSAQWGMIGYGFLVDRVFGFITLLTYFISLFATAYSYAKVGHGKKI
jgi:hypothetical protein